MYSPGQCKCTPYIIKNIHTLVRSLGQKIDGDVRTKNQKTHPPTHIFFSFDTHMYIFSSIYTHFHGFLKCYTIPSTDTFHAKELETTDEGKFNDKIVLKDVLESCAKNFHKKKNGKRYKKGVKEFLNIFYPNPIRTYSIGFYPLVHI